MTVDPASPLAIAVAELAVEHGTARLLPTRERRPLALMLGVPAGRALVDVGDGRVAAVDALGGRVLHDLKAPIR